MRRLSGFSLMEMMVVLLIAAIVAAASAPMVSKKMIASKEAGCPWIRTKGANIAYNLGNKNQSAIIGDISSSTKSRLHIRSDNEPHLSLATKVGVLKFLTSNDTSGLAITSNEDLKALGDVLNNTIAIGSKAVTKGEGAVAIGGGSDANTEAGANSVAIGSGAVASDDTVAIGSGAQTSAGSIAIGSGIQGSGDNSVAIGSNSTGSLKSGTIAVGSNAKAGTSSTTGKNAIAIGTNAEAVGFSSLAIGGPDNGSNTKAGADGAIAIGPGANTGTQTAIAIGSGAKVDKNEEETNYNQNYWRGIAIGDSAKAFGANSSIAIGAYAEAKGWDSVAIGYGAKAWKANDNNQTREAARGATAIGSNAKARHKYSTALGYGTITTQDYQIKLGSTDKYTVYIPGNLVVDGIAVLGRKPTAYTYLRYSCSSGSNYLTHLAVGNGTDHKMYWSGWYDNNTIPGYQVFQDSDRRLKNVGKAFVGGLEEIKKLEVFNYTYKKDPTKTPRVGIMAQDLQKIFPKAVTKGDDGFLRIRMEDMFYALVNAVKELDKKFDLLAQKQKKIEELEAKVEKLETRLAKIEKSLK